MLRAPTAKQLANRDPALFAALGLDSSATFGAEFGADFNGDETSWGAEFGDDMPEMAGDFGSDFGAVTNVNAAAVVKSAIARRQRGAKRGTILNPNKGSDVKVERYLLSLNQNVVIGTASIISQSANPDTEFRPQRFVTAAPCVGFATINDIKVSNVSAIAGGNPIDAFMFNALATGVGLDLPTLTPSNRVNLIGAYTGFVPAGYVVGATMAFTMTFVGPASVMA